MKMNHVVAAFLGSSLMVAAVANAETVPSVLVTPLVLETSEVEPVPTPAAPAAVNCIAPQKAEVYRVTALTQCDEVLPNSHLRGVVNRIVRKCAEETLVAQVFASLKTCETCGVESRVSKIRCERDGCGVCENEEYIHALVGDLMSASRRIRVAATRSLRLCDLRVVSKRECVKEEVPSAFLY